MKYCSQCRTWETDIAAYCKRCGTLLQSSNMENADYSAKNDNPSIPPNTQNTPESGAPQFDSAISVISTETPNLPSGKKKKTIIILAVVLSLCMVLGVVAIVVGNNIKKAKELEKYKKLLDETYEEICDNAKKAESYATLESKVWRNCIYENDSYETDNYTKNEYGMFYDDFNTALLSFYIGESSTRKSVEGNDEHIKECMSELKDYPPEYEEEYKTLKKLYTSYSTLADFVLGDSSYSWTTFNEALEKAKSDYKTAKAEADTILG